MVVRVVRLGSPRLPREGTRIGTVRRPPRGVPKAEHGTRDFYDVWLPNLAPSPETMKLAQQAQQTQGDAQWAAFARKYRAEMARPEAGHVLALLAALSHHADFSVGCYCEDEAHCHRAILRELLAGLGARVEPA